MIDLLLVAVLVLLAVLIFMIGYLLMHQKQLSQDIKKDVVVEWLKDMRQGMDQQSNAIGQRLDNAARVVQALSKEMGSMQEIGRQMRDLQNFLHSPKLRGNIGEQVLYDLLSQYFSSDHYGLQYKFKEGQIVDAIIKTDKGIIPIDAKFPLENFNRLAKAETDEDKDVYMHELGKDIKKHIDSIAKKYILPHEGTVDFAVMYVPSEPVYYEIIRNFDELSHYANERKVLIVSPNSFFYFLKVILMGMEGKKLSEASKKILELLRGLSQDAKKFGKQMSLVSGHIVRTKNAMDEADSMYGRLFSKIESAKTLKIDKPEIEIEEDIIKIASIDADSKEN